jgi:pimeloyl-ACP methyl ester carboxylesterase
MDSRLFLPGWGAPGSLYAAALPSAWLALEPPGFAATRGSLGAYRRWLGAELRRRGPSRLGGHSMGAALAILAAADAPELVERLVLVAPAGLPLDKPIRASARDFLAQLTRGDYPRHVAAAAAVAIARAPRSALALAENIRRLDLRRECARVRSAGIPAVVIGCATDTLVTTDRSRELARSLGARYEELDLRGGHMWMLAHGRRFGELVAALG